MSFVFHDGVKTGGHVKTARRCRTPRRFACVIQRLAILPWLGAVTGTQSGGPMPPILGKNAQILPHLCVLKRSPMESASLIRE